MKGGDEMTALEIELLRNLCEVCPELNDFHRGRLLGYGEGVADMQENDRRKAEETHTHQASGQ